MREADLPEREDRLVPRPGVLVRDEREQRIDRRRILDPPDRERGARAQRGVGAAEQACQLAVGDPPLVLGDRDRAHRIRRARRRRAAGREQDEERERERGAGMRPRECRSGAAFAA